MVQNAIVINVIFVSFYRGTIIWITFVSYPIPIGILLAWIRYRYAIIFTTPHIGTSEIVVCPAIQIWFFFYCLINVSSFLKIKNLTLIGSTMQPISRKTNFTLAPIRVTLPLSTNRIFIANCAIRTHASYRKTAIRWIPNKTLRALTFVGPLGINAMRIGRTIGNTLATLIDVNATLSLERMIKHS